LKRGALAWLAHKIDFPTQIPYDLVDHRESKAATGGSGAEEGVEHPGLDFPRHTMASIRNLQLEAVTHRYTFRDRPSLAYGCTPYGHTDHSISVSDRFRRVRNEVHHDLPKLCGIGPDRRKILAQIGFQRCMLLNRDFEQVEHLDYDLRKVDQFDN